MGGGKGGGGGEAAAARRDEQERQQRIRQGTSRINEIFNGSTVGTGQLGNEAVFDPTKTYYLANGSVWRPSAAPAGGAGGGGDTRAGYDLSLPNNAAGSSHVTQENRYAGGDLVPLNGGRDAAGSSGLTPEEQFRQALGAGLYSGTQRTSGFGDEFFNQRRQVFIDYANPQLEDQYAKAQKELTFALARSGNLNSSARAQKAGELQQLYDQNKQQIADQALGYEKEARTAVEDARSNLIATLNATGDAQGAANAAMARSAVLSKPAAFSPLSNLFADFTAGLGTQAALERSYAYGGGQQPRYNTGLFAPRNGAVQVT